MDEFAILVYFLSLLVHVKMEFVILISGFYVLKSPFLVFPEKGCPIEVF